MGKPFYILIIVLQLVSCDSKRRCETARVSEINLGVDTVRIHIPASCLPNYTKTCVDRESGDLWCYNYQTHALDVFDLSDNSFKGTMELDKRGPKGINRVTDLIVQNGVITVSSGSYIFMFDESLTNFNRYDLSASLDKKGFTTSRGIVAGGAKSPFFYDSNNSDQLYFKVFPNANKKYTEEYYHGPFLARYNLSSQTSELLEGINYPSFVRENYSLYGDLHLPNVIKVEGSYIVNFPSHDKIYTFSEKEGLIDKVSVPASLEMRDSRIKNKLSAKQIVEHSYESSKFYPVNYNEFRKCYSRVQSTFRKIGSTDFKQFSISILNADLALLKEQKLPGDVFSGESFINEKGWWFQIRSTDEVKYLDYIQFYVLNFEQ